LTEAEQVLLSRQGDVSAWEGVVSNHQQAVFRLAYLLLGDPDDAEDVTQEAFIRAYYALGRFDVQRPIRPWLLSIAANLARNRRRSIGRYLGFLQRLGREEPQSAAPAQADLGRVSNRDEAQLLWQAVRRLSASDQEIIYLRYFLDMPEAEMSATLSVAAGTVKSRLHRALGRLKQVIQQGFPDLHEGFEP
jgi:RNA polymerase sigma-70 factor (ECF subfamily)